MLSLILRVAAFLRFAVLVFGEAVGSLRLLPLGLALWVLADLLLGYGPALPQRRQPTP